MSEFVSMHMAQSEKAEHSQKGFDRLYRLGPAVTVLDQPVRRGQPILPGCQYRARTGAGRVRRHYEGGPGMMEAANRGAKAEE